MDFRLGSKTLKEYRDAAWTALRGFLRRSKLPLLMLVYPVCAWLFLVGAPPLEKLDEFDRELVEPLTTAVYVLMIVGVAYCVAVSLWANFYRSRPAKIPHALRAGLLATFAFITLLLPIQAVVLGLAIYLYDSEELLLWSLFIVGGSITATVILLTSGLRDRPGIYTTRRVKKLDLARHPRLAETLQELSETLQVPVPSQIVVGLQPEIISFFGTVFCPDGELDGGVLLLSLPLAAVTSVAEFQALAGEALLGLRASGTDSRLELQSNVEQARQVVLNLQQSMRDWRWIPRNVIHPAYIIIRFIVVLSLRFHLYLGQEIVVFLVNQFLESRRHADAVQMVDAHNLSSANVGRVQVVSGYIKEAALSLSARFPVRETSEPLHPLAEVAKCLWKAHPNSALDVSAPSPWQHPVLAWNNLEVRCKISGVSLPWCLQMAKDVTTETSALSLFNDVGELERELQEILKQPFVVARPRAAGAPG